VSRELFGAACLSVYRAVVPETLIARKQQLCTVYAVHHTAATAHCEPVYWAMMTSLCWHPGAQKGCA
jgi:hypothetical protein